ncbi:hypothetical protein B0H13DRAFT_2317804 [Mycena leptocephala]|nr:hypothetical protein B0H13DRAFT_2317804 [Mycena leptocephala]
MSSTSKVEKRRATLILGTLINDLQQHTTFLARTYGDNTSLLALTSLYGADSCTYRTRASPACRFQWRWGWRKSSQMEMGVQLGGEEHLDAYWGILTSTAEMELEIEKEMEKVAHIDADGDRAGLEQEEKARSSRHPERLRSAGEGAGAALARVYPALVRPPSFSLAFASALLAQAPLPLLERRSRLAHCRLLFLGRSAWHGRGGVYEAYPTSSLRPCPRPRTLLLLSAPALVLVHPQTEILLTWTPTRLPSSSAHALHHHASTPWLTTYSGPGTRFLGLLHCRLAAVCLQPQMSYWLGRWAGMVTPWEMLRIEGEQRRRLRQSACGMHAGMTVFDTAVPLGGRGS